MGWTDIDCVNHFRNKIDWVFQRLPLIISVFTETIKVTLKSSEIGSYIIFCKGQAFCRAVPHPTQSEGVNFIATNSQA